MTNIMMDEYSEVNLPSWSYDTLRPPRFTPKNIFKDLEWHIRLYKESGLPARTIAGFIILRLFQRLFYNYGWARGGRDGN